MHAAHICCILNTGNPEETGSSCSCHASCSKECPSTNACDIPCHTCAATKIWPCLHGTMTPDPGDLGTVTWTIHGPCSCHVLPHTSPVTYRSKSPCKIISERGMLYDRVVSFRFTNCSHSSRLVDESSFCSIYKYMFLHLKAYVVWVSMSMDAVDKFNVNK